MELGYLLKEVFKERLRVILTVIAIAWGTLAIALMLSVGQGMLSTLVKVMDQMGNNLLVVSGGVTSDSYQGTPIGTDVKITAKDMKSISKLPEVDHISPEYTSIVSLKYKDQKIDLQAISGVDRFYQKLRGINIGSGRFINQEDIAHSRFTVVLGTEAKQSLFQRHIALGKYINFFDQYKFQVVGVLKKEQQLYSYQAPDSYLAWIPYTTFKKIFKNKDIGHLLVIYHLQPGESAQVVSDKVTKAIAVNHQVNPKDKNILTLFNNKLFIEKTQNFFYGLELFLGLIGTITLLISSLGIANVMFIAVQSAIPEIGIRMACGARSFDIVKHYLLEAFLVTLIGGVLGMGLSYLIMLGVNPFLVNVKLFKLSGLHLTLSPLLVLAIIFVLGCVGMLAGIFPALKAARIQPVEALRYE